MLDFWKRIAILHEAHLLCNPLSLGKVDELLALLRLGPGARVLDIACGKGEVLCRAVERSGARGVGVDLSPYAVADARAKVRERGLEGRIGIEEIDAARFEAPPGSFEVAMCLGASWIWKGYAPTLAALARFTRPGGLVVAGEPFWIREPSPEYLQAARLTRDAFASHLENTMSGESAGLHFLHAIVSSHDDWDRYEGYKRYSVEMYAAAHPDDPELADLLAETRRYADDVYLRWGRDELGWAVYLYRKPGATRRG
jgi:SAM-dependent methyltransferase